MAVGLLKTYRQTLQLAKIWNNLKVILFKLFSPEIIENVALGNLW